MPSVRRLVTVAVVAALCSTVVASADRAGGVGRRSARRSSRPAPPLRRRRPPRERDPGPRAGRRPGSRSGRAGLQLRPRPRRPRPSARRGGARRQRQHGVGRQLRLRRRIGRRVVPQITRRRRRRGVAVVERVDRRAVPRTCHAAPPRARRCAETLHAVTTPAGSVDPRRRAVRQRRREPDPKPMDVYDVVRTRLPQLASCRPPTTGPRTSTTSRSRRTAATSSPPSRSKSSTSPNCWTTRRRRSTRRRRCVPRQHRGRHGGPPVATGPMADLDDAPSTGPRCAAATHPSDSATRPGRRPTARAPLYVGGQTPEFEPFSSST